MTDPDTKEAADLPTDKAALKDETEAPGLANLMGFGGLSRFSCVLVLRIAVFRPGTCWRLWPAASMAASFSALLGLCIGALRCRTDARGGILYGQSYRPYMPGRWWYCWIQR